MKIMIDPGHAGSNTGAVSIIPEGKQNWTISNAIVRALKDYPITAVLSRTQNESPSLQERALRAKQQNCDALISVHFNAGGGDGCEVWRQDFVKDTTAIQSKLISINLEKVMVAAGQQTRGIKIKYNKANTRDYYGILYESQKVGIPAVLFEIAFVDSADAYDFDTDVELAKWGKVIAQGIANTYNLKKIVPVVSTPITNTLLKVGSRVKIIGTHYATGQKIPAWVKLKTYTVARFSQGKVLLKEINSWVNIADVKVK